ncbi:MAG TPA: hypothetical protein DHW82_09650 [Spirochaetia bacterium]|nr:MAG: hypothetical protein A2Y41_00505 [Spirochaetes bacterium GWB1_36_13]HCL57255.1 hypothetical protein [Spirochaetia bacterium]
MKINKIKFKQLRDGHHALDLSYIVSENGFYVEYQVKRTEQITEDFENDLLTLIMTYYRNMIPINGRLDVNDYSTDIESVGSIALDEIKKTDSSYQHKFMIQYKKNILKIETGKIETMKFENGEMTETKHSKLLERIFAHAEAYANGENGEPKLFDMTKTA